HDARRHVCQHPALEHAGSLLNNDFCQPKPSAAPSMQHWVLVLLGTNPCIIETTHQLADTTTRHDR
ncbi:MAG: hypothetical protein RSA14_04090, partial [Raoultibacter sp.]